MSHSQHSTVQYSTPTYVYTNTHSFPEGCEEGKERIFLLVPLGHLLTLSLDLSQFRLCGDLRDAFHWDAFKEHCTLGVKMKENRRLNLIEFKATLSHTYKKKKNILICRWWFPNSCFFALWITVCRKNRYKNYKSSFFLLTSLSLQLYCESTSIGVILPPQLTGDSTPTEASLRNPSLPSPFVYTVIIVLWWHL